MGESVGRWEQDTLIVDTIGFNDKTWLDVGGKIHSEDLHVVERYSPTADGRIHYEAVAEDPKMFTRPWKVFGRDDWRGPWRGHGLRVRMH